MSKSEQREKENRLASELDEVLRETGRMFSVNIGQIRVLQEETASVELPSFHADPAEIFDRVCIKKQFSSLQTTENSNNSNFSIAARHGTSISPSTIQKMEADRQNVRQIKK